MQNTLSLKLCLFGCISLSLVSIALAQYALLNDDMAAIIAFSQAIAKGKHLYTDLITSQPPLIFYLMMVPLWGHELTGISVPNAFFVFSFMLLFCCAVLSWNIARRNTLCQSSGASLSVMFGITFASFILPLKCEGHYTDFGQREPLICALILPYLMLVINRLQSKEGERFEKILAGILGAIGFCIKPQFIIIFVFAEIFVAIVRRSFLEWVRIETIIIAIFSALYCLFVFCFMPEYFTLIPKFLFSYESSKSAWVDVYKSSWIGVCVAFVIVFLRRHSPHFITILFLALLIVLAEILFAAPRLIYYYHFIPVLFFGVILVAFAAPYNKALWNIVIVGALLYYYRPYVPFINLEFLGNQRQEVLREATFIAPYKNVIFINRNHGAYFPLVTYADVDWNMSMIDLDYLPIVYNYLGKVDSDEEIIYHSLDEMGENERFFYDKIIMDMQRLPDAIVIDVSPLKAAFYPVKFDYLHYFMQDPRFRELWSHYELVTQFKKTYVPLYNLETDDAIYRRKD